MASIPAVEDAQGLGVDAPVPVEVRLIFTNWLPPFNCACHSAVLFFLVCPLPPDGQAVAGSPTRDRRRGAEIRPGCEANRATLPARRCCSGVVRPFQRPLKRTSPRSLVSP